MYTPLDRGMVLLQIAAKSLLCSILYTNEFELYSQKRQIRFLSHSLGDLELMYALHL